MQKIPINQNTEEWELFRNNHIGASDCAPIMGESIYRNRYRVWQDKMGLPSYVSSAMQRGKDLEPQVLQKVINQLHLNFNPLVVISDERPWQMASLDGFDEEYNLILEIKCPNEKTCQNAKLGFYPSDWIWQVQHQMSVTAAHKSLICVCDGDLEKLFFIEIDRDEDKISQLNLEEQKFFERYVLPMAPPPHKDFDLPDCPEYETVLREMYEIDYTIKCLKTQYDALEKQAIEYGDNTSFRAGNFSFKKREMKGRISYSKIPELKSLDLEPYRGDPIISWSLKSLE